MQDLDLGRELKRAAFPQAVLGVLSQGKSHGHASAEVLRGHGFARIKGGTLYPLLKRLEDQGCCNARLAARTGAPAGSSSHLLTAAVRSWAGPQQPGIV
ncbi:PadR family transcriptional regulator [Arthrobacter sp. NPDC057388]|uniref:PadR family transcriptional regulator n=1 Tax=Arthrobacter sp. NPDC057388 TaxID=3346116 RepID=UPI003632B086